MDAKEVKAQATNAASRIMAALMQSPYMKSSGEPITEEVLLAQTIRIAQGLAVFIEGA